MADLHGGTPTDPTVRAAEPSQARPDATRSREQHHEALVEIGQLEGLAESLRRELLPTSTPRPEVTVAVDYVPAMNALGFGGDWFDTVDPHPDRLVLVVGDVAGHGVAAAARMALAQGAIRGLVMRSAMNDVPRLATRALTGARREFFATIGIIELDLAEMTVSCALAGHPPPMMRTDDGAVTRLGGAPQPPVGLATARHDPPTPGELQPGSLVVLYSDGLVERRDSDLTERLDQLEGVVADLPDGMAPDDALSQICEEMLTGEAEDDVAILVARVEP